MELMVLKASGLRGQIFNVERGIELAIDIPAKDVGLAFERIGVKRTYPGPIRFF